MADPTLSLSDSKSSEIIVVAWTFTGLAVLVVVLKIITTTRIIRSSGWDDFWLLLSTTCSIIASVLVHYAAVLGLGRRTAALMEEFRPDRIALAAKIQILGYPFNIAAFSLPNLSIAILVVKLLDPNPHRKRALFGMVILQVVFALIMAIMAFVQCNPVEHLWDRSIPGSCWDPSVLNNYSYFVSGYTTLTDLILAIVPITSFWRLQMNRSTKVGVSVLMSLTFLSAVVTVIKATYLHLFTDTTDPLYNVVDLVYWGLIEQNIVILAAYVPTLRPLFTRFFRTKYGSRKTGTTKDSQVHVLTSISVNRVEERGIAVERLSSPALPKRRPVSQLHLSKREDEDNATDSDNSTGHHATPSASEELSHEVDDDARSQDSRQGILKTVNVSMQWDDGEPTEPGSEEVSHQTVGQIQGMPRKKASMSETRRRQIVPESLYKECTDDRVP